MNSKKMTLLLGALLLATAQTAFAAGGETGGGGGPKEIAFKDIVRNLGEWIASNNADQIQLTADTTIATYKKKMLSVISNYDIEFTDSLVQVDGHEKACRGYVDENEVNQIRCNAQDYPTDINQIYQLVHHEIAGLAGLENNRGADSDYHLSNQISGFLTDEIVRRLPVASLRPAMDPNGILLDADGNVKLFGAYAAQDSCPSGYHLPTNRELVNRLNPGAMKKSLPAESGISNYYSETEKVMYWKIPSQDGAFWYTQGEGYTPPKSVLGKYMFWSSTRAEVDTAFGFIGFDGGNGVLSDDSDVLPGQVGSSNENAVLCLKN